MTRLRPIVLVATVALALVALLAPPASADETIPSGSPWGGSSVTRPDPVTSPIVELRIKGRIQQNDTDSTVGRPDVAVTLSNDPQRGCVLAPSGPATAATLDDPTLEPRIPPRWLRYPFTADVPFAPTRNGSYQVFVCIDGVRRMDTVALVRLPAPPVTNLVASSSGHDVALTWDDARPQAPDLSGYRIERSLGSGAFEPVETIGAGTPTYTDTSLPAGGGEASYRVIAIRPEVGDGAASNTAVATYEPAPPGSTGSTAPGGDSGGGGSTTGATGSGGGGGSGRPATRPSRASGPAIRIPRVGSPSRNFFPALLAPPVDTGFDTELPYDRTGEDDELAGDELGADPVDALPGRGLAIPIATGLVLAVWALHLRFLARAARPEYEERVEILG